MDDLPAVGPVAARRNRSDRFLAILAPFGEVVLVTHVNPDPDALGSMLGLEALVRAKLPGRSVVITSEWIIARAENQAMVDLIQIPLVPIDRVPIGPGTAVVMVDSQPRTGRRASEAAVPVAVLDHHETGGVLDGVRFRDLRPNLGATCTMVTSYLLEQEVAVSPRLATALLYGIETEIEGFPREASPADDGALVWLFPRADKELLARIRNPRLPLSYFATLQHALANAFLYGDLVVAWCGEVDQPDIVAELADVLVRCDRVRWAVTFGRFGDLLKLSMRAAHVGSHCGDCLRAAVDGLGTAGGHDKRAGGAISLPARDQATIDHHLRILRQRLLDRLGIDDPTGLRFLDASPVIDAP